MRQEIQVTLIISNENRTGTWRPEVLRLDSQDQNALTFGYNHEYKTYELLAEPLARFAVEVGQAAELEKGK